MWSSRRGFCALFRAVLSFPFVNIQGYMNAEELDGGVKLQDHLLACPTDAA